MCAQAENELLRQYQQQLLEKEHSGCAALLRDDKVGAAVHCSTGSGRQPCHGLAEWHAGKGMGTGCQELVAVDCLEMALQACKAVLVAPCVQLLFSNNMPRLPLTGVAQQSLCTCTGGTCPSDLAPLPLPLLQKQDLARMYKLFKRIPKGLEPMADIFKKHVEEEGGCGRQWGAYL